MRAKKIPDVSTIGNLFSCLLPLTTPYAVPCSHYTDGRPVTTTAGCPRRYRLPVLAVLGMVAPNRQAA